MNTFKRISVQEAHELIAAAPDILIVDIRDAGSFEQGHIDGARSVNDSNIEAFLKTSSRESPLLCYCYRGNSSQPAARFFVDNGFKQVYSMDGGWEAWRLANG